jgi:hypothetical protein
MQRAKNTTTGYGAGGGGQRQGPADKYIQYIDERYHASVYLVSDTEPTQIPPIQTNGNRTQKAH